MNAHPNTNVNRGGHAPGQLQFRAGQMIEFITTRPFTLGATGIQVRNGTVILFDGTNAEVDGAKYVLPFLRGAVKAGWLVLAEEYDPENPAYVERARANIQVRDAKGGNPLDPKPRQAIITTESDEREVGNTRQHAARTAANNRNFVRGQTTVNGVAPGQTVRTQRGMMVVEEQDGIELDRKLSTPAGERSKERIDMSSDKAAQAMRTAQTTMVKPGQGMTQEEMLSRMSPEEQEDYLARKEALRSQYVPDSPAPTQALPRPTGTRVVARVQSSRGGEHEGMSFRNSVGGGTLIGDSSDGEVVGRVHAEDAEEQVIEQEGITFRTSGLKKSPAKKADPDEFVPQRAQVRVAVSAEPPPPVPANLDVRRQVAKMVCPEFPENYDFTLSPKKKLARLQADYEDRHDILRAVYAAESDDMKALLLQEFPQAFTQ